MCRFIAYVGRPIMVDELLLKPRNSLIHQSYGAEEMSQTLNGDGFGLGWYMHQISEKPGLFRSISPAWNNQNLIYNAPLIQTTCMFAHIRAASTGRVSETNTHPFHFEKYLMMHNGDVPQFSRIKRRLLSLLDDDLFLWIKGQTDSEHVFALLMQQLAKLRGDGPPLDADQIRQGFQMTFDIIEKLKREAGIVDEASTFNMMITDGHKIYGTRFSSDPENATRTLYFSSGDKFECKDGFSRMTSPDSGHKAVLIVSEKLNDFDEEWTVIPPNHFIAVEDDLKTSLLPLRCL